MPATKEWEQQGFFLRYTGSTIKQANTKLPEQLQSIDDA
jgi:hypothetical protein